jgi:hypothetical protein
MPLLVDGRGSRRDFCQYGLAFIASSIKLAPSLAAPANVQLDATVVADLRIQPRDGPIFELAPHTNLLTDSLWSTVKNTAFKMQQMFQIKHNVGFLGYNDLALPSYAAANGYIVNEPTSHNGVLLIGENMTKSLMAIFSDRPNAQAVSGSIAHEMAHIFQFGILSGQTKSWWDTMLDADGNVTRRRAELHADFLAGWCLGNFAEFQDVDIFSRKLFAMGESEIRDTNTHGTPQQRYASAIRGFYSSRHDRLAVEAAAREGALFVNGIVPMEVER